MTTTANNSQLPSWAKTLRVCMAEHGLSQTELSKRAGVHHMTVYQHYHGRREPTPATIGKYAKAFGVTAKELMSEMYGG